MWKPFKKLEARIHQAAAWRGTPIVLFLLAFADFFVSVIPLDALVAAAILGLPRRSFYFCLGASLGRMGAVALVAAISLSYPMEQIYAFMSSLPGFGWGTEKAQSFFEQYGALSMGITAVVPWIPMQLITLLCLGAKSSILMMEISLGIGMVLRYLMLTLSVIAGKRLLIEAEKESE